jgi:hypothetical protein
MPLALLVAKIRSFTVGAEFDLVERKEGTL